MGAAGGVDRLSENGLRRAKQSGSGGRADSSFDSLAPHDYQSGLCALLIARANFPKDQTI
jgi:hypothetical protein